MNKHDFRVVIFQKFELDHYTAEATRNNSSLE